MALLAQQTTLNLDFSIHTDTVSAGLIHRHYHSDSSDSAPLSIHVLEADLNDIYLLPTLALDQIIGQETTSSMVSRKGAIAGINGGFSYSNDPWNRFHGDPKDLFVLDGVILSEPFSSRASFGVQNFQDSTQYPFVDQLKLSLNILANTEPQVQLTGVNRARGTNDLILYTPEWHTTTLTAGDGLEWVFQPGQILQQPPGINSSPIPSNGFVLSASGTYIDSLSRIEDDIQIQVLFSSLLNPGVTPRLANTSYQTAGPILILNGNIISDHSGEQIPEAFVTTRHPRTAVGISEDTQKLWMVVVDGRQPGLSVGMSLPELTTFLKGLGAYHAYNLDGGGSSTMVIRNNVVNAPSDPKERRRCDALLLFPK